MTVSNQLIIRKVDDKTIIINLKNGMVSVLDDIGELFWAALSEDNKEAVFDQIVSEYDVSRKTLEDDYQLFIERMKDLAIIW